MPKDHFVVKLRESYAAMSPSERQQKIRKLVSESKDNAEFIREQFPDFFTEAFPSSNGSKNGAAPKSVSNARSALASKRR